LPSNHFLFLSVPAYPRRHHYPVGWGRNGATPNLITSRFSLGWEEVRIWRVEEREPLRAKRKFCIDFYWLSKVVRREERNGQEEERRRAPLKWLNATFAALALLGDFALARLASGSPPGHFDQ